jgi:hypothetical protein
MQLGLGLSLVKTSTALIGAGGGVIPPNAILFNGVPIVYNGEYLTYN